MSRISWNLSGIFHLNPLRAGIVKDLGQLDRYAYAGHSALVGRLVRPRQDTAEVLGRFGGRMGRARERYRMFVQEGIRQPQARSDGGGLVRSMGGWKAVSEIRRGAGGVFGRRACSWVIPVCGAASQGSGRNRAASQTDGRFSDAGAADCPQDGLDMGGRFGTGEIAGTIARAVGSGLCLGAAPGGGSGRELSRALGVSPQAVSLAARRAGGGGNP